MAKKSKSTYKLSRRKVKLFGSVKQKALTKQQRIAIQRRNGYKYQSLGANLERKGINLLKRGVRYSTKGQVLINKSNKGQV